MIAKSTIKYFLKIPWIYIAFYEFSMKFDLEAYSNLKMSKVDMSIAYLHFKR